MIHLLAAVFAAKGDDGAPVLLWVAAACAAVALVLMIVLDKAREAFVFLALAVMFAILSLVLGV